jgi:hypothetical protein
VDKRSGFGSISEAAFFNTSVVNDQHGRPADPDFANRLQVLTTRRIE